MFRGGYVGPGPYRLMVDGKGTWTIRTCDAVAGQCEWYHIGSLAAVRCITTFEARVLHLADHPAPISRASKHKPLRRASLTKLGAYGTAQR